MISSLKEASEEGCARSLMLVVGSRWMALISRQYSLYVRSNKPSPPTLPVCLRETHNRKSVSSGHNKQAFKASRTFWLFDHLTIIKKDIFLGILGRLTCWSWKHYIHVELDNMAKIWSRSFLPYWYQNVSQYIICWQFAEYPDNDRSLKKPEGSFVKL